MAGEASMIEKLIAEIEGSLALGRETIALSAEDAAALLAELDRLRDDVSDAYRDGWNACASETGD
jgi:hypothetical protein